MVLVIFIVSFFILSIVIIMSSRIEFHIENLNIDTSKRKENEDFNIRITIGPLGINLLDVSISEKQLKNVVKESINNLKINKGRIIIQKNIYKNVTKELKKANGLLSIQSGFLKR